MKNQSDALTISVGPTITKRSTKTSVLVKDSQTVVIGGLMQEQDEESVSKMPWLADIPVVGWLFKTKHVSKNKTNLLVFLTPSVIKGSDRLAQITSTKQKEFGMSEQRFAEGELLVRFKEGVSQDAALDIIAKQGASVIRYVEGIRVFHLRLQKGRTVEEGVKDFSSLQDVEYAEPNYVMRLKQAQ